MNKRPIGILGGMGPAAGVYFQELIIAATPAKSDQEHIPVIVYADPTVPDRTETIRSGHKGELVRKLKQGIGALEQCDVQEIFIPCNTTFFAFDDFSKGITTPIYHLPERTVTNLATATVEPKKILLLATVGTYLAGTYHNYGRSHIEIVYPDDALQHASMQLITAIKSGDVPDSYLQAVLKNIDPGLDGVILGCTELSMLAAKFRAELGTLWIVDPLEIAAKYIVSHYFVSG